MPAPIPVLCDRCRAEGLGGETPFADLGDLLEFEPVPRRPRVDGWTPELQRHFIAALAITGSDRQAAHAVGKAQFGVDQLKKAKDNEGFMAARERALAMAADDRSRRLAAGLHAVTAPAALWRPPDPAWGKAATRQILPEISRGGGPAEPVEGPLLETDDSDSNVPEGLAGKVRGLPPELLVRLEVCAQTARTYLFKLQAERRCRLEGRIAEADFYIRQVTMLEVALDVVWGDGMAVLREARRGGHDLLHIAETETSKQLDEARRKHWEACGDPPRPEYPPRHLLVEHDGYATEPMIWLGHGDTEERRRQSEQFARDAEAHIRWEAEARRDAEARRA